MCGVVGFIGQGNLDDLRRMTKALAHRGPDGEGLKAFQADAAFLGHRRLSIVDIDGGHQPMCNEDATVWVSFNGEIYNHAALRAELRDKGHTFTSDHSDTEVLVHGWEEWGEALPQKLNGMFAFAIWDRRSKSFFLARDRFGEKPLYWGHTNDVFLFASELSAFPGHHAFTPELDSLSLKKYFAHGYVPAPNAIYRNTQKLQPGHWLKLESGKAPHIQAYWQFHIEPATNPPSLNEAAEEVRSLLLRSVERRLMSDVPLGVFLSGGMDSSAAVAAMCQLRDPESVNSFCIGFNEPTFDESAHAQAMADAVNCHHHANILDMDAARILIGEVLVHMDEPLADGSLLPTYLLSRFARQRVTVALSGDGGDELFGGYDPFKALKVSGIYHAVMPKFAHKVARCLADLLPQSGANMSLDFKIRRTLQGLDFGPELWNPVWLAPLEPCDIEDLFNEPIHTDELYSEVLALWSRTDQLGVVDKTLEFFSNFYLPDNILTKVDRASMQNGLEARSVFLDNDLVDFVRTLPAAYKFDGRNQKVVLKKALEGLVPQSILDRPKKGFGIPLMAWMRDLPLNADGSQSAGLSSESITSRIQNHQIGKEDHRLFLWAWTALQNFQRGELARHAP